MKKNLILSMLVMTGLMLMVLGSVSAAITSIEVTLPDGGEYWSGVQDITWDTDGSGTDKVVIYWRIISDGTGKIVTALASDGSYSWDTNVESVIDDTGYSILIEDWATGSIFDESNDFTIDNTDPIVTIDSVDTPTKDNTQVITGTFDELYIDTITVNGVEANIEDSTYSATIDLLIEDENPVTVIATDLAENTGEVSDTIVLDTTEPTVEVAGATADLLVGASGVEASVICSDENDCDEESYKLKIYDTDPVECPTNYGDYVDSPQTIFSHKWVCAAAKDNADNVGFSAEPVEFKVFAKIQDAINAASKVVVETISVAAGTYEENILIDKALTVRSTDGAEDTIILSSPAFRYMVRIYNSDVTFEGFTVTNPTYQGGSDATGILIGAYLGEDPVSNVNVLNNIVTKVRDGDSGGSSMYGATGINIGRGPVSNIVISGNRIEDIHNPDGASVDHTCGINVWDNGTDITITNNTISDIKYNGILLQYATNVQIENNDITETQVGIKVDPFEGATVSGLTINYNKIAGNTVYGVENTMNPTAVDATYNWWGHETGPTHENNPEGEGDAVSDNVDFDPWWYDPEGELPELYDWIIPLSTGMNLISIPLVPEDTDYREVFDDVKDNLDRIWVYQYYKEGKNKWRYRYRDDGEWKGSDAFTDIVPGYGYIVFMDNDDTLYGTGKTIQYGDSDEEPVTPSEIRLANGYNLIGLFGKTSKSVSVALSSLTSLEGKPYWHKVLYMDGSEVTGTLKAGEGYWISMKHLPDTATENYYTYYL